MGKDRGKGGSAAGKGKSSATAPKAIGKDGTSASPADAAKALDKEVRAECEKAFGYFKKGNAKQCTKEMERLIKKYPGHPLPHIGHVRISHKLALEQRTLKNVTRLFKESHERVSAALDACPDSILVKLMFVEVVYDNPFPSDEAVARVETLATAELPSGAGRSDLKVAKALARESFDEHILKLPFFPDINRHQKTEEFVAAMRNLLKDSYDQICDLLRTSKRFMQQQAVGNAGAEVAEGVSGKAADDLVRLESFISIRENNHSYHRVSKQASIKQIAQQKELEEHKRNQEYARVNLDLRRREEETNRRRAAAIEAAKERADSPTTVKSGVGSEADEPTRNGGGSPGAAESNADSPRAKDASVVSIVEGATTKARAEDSQAKQRSKLADFADVAVTAKQPKTKAERESNAAREREIKEKLLRRRQFESVRKYWKTEVEKDPMSVLSMTDIPLKELRNFVDKLYDGPRRSEDLKIVRDIVQGYISTGKWIRWKCNFKDCCGGGEHLTAEDMFACIESRFPQYGTGTSRDQVGDARHGILPIVTPHDVNICGWIGKVDESTGLGGGAFPKDHELPSVVAVNNAVTPADIADVVAGRRAPLLSVDNALYRRDAINEESIRRQTQRAESRNGVNAGVVTDSDDEEDFAEPLVDTTMLRRIASQNHYHVDLNNEREWELPELLDRDYRKARYALLKDALSRLEEEPELLDKLREHMLQPTLLPVLTGAMKLEHEEEEQRQRKEYARFDMSLLDEAEGLPFPDCFKRYGDEFLKYFTEVEHHAQLEKGNFKSRIMQAQSRQYVDMDMDYKDLEQMCISHNMNFNDIFKDQISNFDKLDKNIPGSTPAGRFLKYAETTNRLRVQSIREAVSQSISDPSTVPKVTAPVIRGPNGDDIYVEVVKFLLDTDTPASTYAPYALKQFKHCFTGSEAADRALRELEEKAKWVQEHAPLPSWDYLISDDSGTPPDDEQKLTEDIIFGIWCLMRAGQMPLRLMQVMAQFISARLHDIRNRFDEKEKAGIGLRRRRPKLGAPERVLADSPDATVGRTSSRTPEAAVEAESSKSAIPTDPIRTDDFGTRLRLLEKDDLKALWSFLMEYSIGSRNTRDRTMLRHKVKSNSCLWQMLSEESALFGITGETGVEFVTGGGAKAEDTKKDVKSKGGKGGKGRKPAPKGKCAEYCVDESSRTFRLCVGVWQALYPMGPAAMIPGLISEAKSEEEAFIRAKTAAAQPKEDFVGENLLNWLYSESTETATSQEEVANYVLPSDDEYQARFESCVDQLKTNNEIFRGIACVKVVIRHRIDAIMTCANSMLADRMPLDTIRALDPANPKDEAKMRMFFEEYAKLRYMIKALRKKLLDMDLHELDTETQYFREYTQMIQLQHEQYNQRVFELSGPKKVEIFQKDKRDDPKEAERLREKQEMQLRLKLSKDRLEALQHSRRRTSDAILYKRNKVEKIVASKNFLAAEEKSSRVILHKHASEQIDAAIASWKESGGNIPAEAMEICRKLQSLPDKMTPTLVAAQERLLVFDLQMEAIMNERNEIITDIIVYAKVEYYRWLHPTLIHCLQSMLERRAEAANTAEKELEQELLLADESKAEEERRRKEEKAKAKKAREKEEKRLRREKEAAEAAEVQAKARAEQDAADARLKAELEAVAKARAAAKAEADAAEELELQERRRVLEAEEAAEHERLIREMHELETARAASMITAERDAREAAAAEQMAIERAAQEAEEAEAAAVEAEARAKEQERRKREDIMAAANAKLAAAKAAEAASIAAAAAAAEAAKIAAEAAREAAEAQALANGEERPQQPRLSARASDFTPSNRAHNAPASSESSTDSPGDGLFDSAGSHGYAGSRGGRGGRGGRGRGGRGGRGYNVGLKHGSSTSLASDGSDEYSSASPHAPPMPPGMPPMIVGPNGVPVPLYPAPHHANGIPPPGIPPGFQVPYGYPPGMVPPPPGYPPYVHGHGSHAMHPPPPSPPVVGHPPPPPPPPPPPLPPGPPPAARAADENGGPAPPPAAALPPVMKFGEHSLPMDPGAYAQYQAQYQAHAATRAQMQNGELDASYDGPGDVGKVSSGKVSGEVSAIEANARAASEAAKVAANRATRAAEEAAHAAEEAAAIEHRLAEEEYPALALPAPGGGSANESSAGSTGPPVDDNGFAVDELQAALEASVRETRKERPKRGYARALSGEALDGLASDSQAPQRAEGPGGGLRNLEGEYNCFLNVVIQSLWHLPPFSRAVQDSAKGGSAWRGNGRGDEDPDAEVAAALRDVFRAMDQSNGFVRAMDQSNGSVADSGDSNGTPHADIGAVQNAVAPTALRKALAVLTQGRGSLFGENEMADASEALQAIFHSVHRALRPAPGTKHARPLSAAASSRSGGMFLDQESGYCSVVHRCFGVDVEESMTCSRCAVRSRTLRYTKFLHLVPAAALNLAMAYADGVDSMESAMRHIDGSDAKPCDVDAGGCGAMNGIEHALAADGVQRKSPAIFCVALAWESASATSDQVAETLANVQTTLNLAEVYERAPRDAGTYHLRCAMCYYGEHYAAFAVTDAGRFDGHERWMLFDDHRSKEVGEWEEVARVCAVGRMQPCVLFYQRENATVEV